MKYSIRFEIREGAPLKTLKLYVGEAKKKLQTLIKDNKKIVPGSMLLTKKDFDSKLRVTPYTLEAETED